MKKYNSSNHWGMLVNDGLCYTRAAPYDKDWNISNPHETKALLFIYTTFLSEEELSDSQKKH